MARKHVAATLATVCVLLSSGKLTSAQTLDFTQLDYYNNGSLSVANSEWGQLDLSYTPSSNLSFLNVVVNPGTANAYWAVQNNPLLSVSSLGSNPTSSSMYFDLGTSRGLDVSSLNIGYVYSSAPITDAPTSYTTTTVGVGNSQAIINSGVPSGDNTLHVTPPQIPAPPDAPAPPAPPPPIEVLVRPDMPNVIQEKNWCGPGSAANSLQWLTGNEGNFLNQTNEETMIELAGDMHNTHCGNWDDTELAGKQQFIKDHNLSIEVTYTGGHELPNDGGVTFTWLKNALDNGEDVEIMTKTHWVVLSGYIDAGPGNQFLQYRDDPYQHGIDTTVDEQDVIDHRFVWTQFEDGSANIGNGEEIVYSAISEASTPEPSTIASLSLGTFGTMCLAIRRRKKRAA